MRPLVVLVLLSLGTLGPIPAGAAPLVLELHHAHSGQDLRLAPFGRYGRLTRGAAARLRHFLTTAREPQGYEVHPRLVRMLVHLQTRFGRPVLHIYSAFRGSRNGSGQHGYHGLGRAADLRIPGVDPRVVFTTCRGLPDAGCGYYPNQQFAHVDARPRSAYWIDLTTGRGSRYVSGVDAWLARNPVRNRPREP